MNEEDSKRIRNENFTTEEQINEWKIELSKMMKNYLMFGRGEHEVHTYRDRGMIDGVDRDKTPVGLPKRFVVSFEDMIKLMRRIKDAEG